MMGECEHFLALGQIHPKQACFVLCSPECIKHKEVMQPSLLLLIKEHHTQHAEALEVQKAAQKVLRDELRGHGKAEEKQEATAAAAAAGKAGPSTARRKSLPTSKAKAEKVQKYFQLYMGSKVLYMMSIGQE